MPTTNVLAGVAVRSLAESIEWYARLLGRAPDAQPIPTAAEWKFDGGGWLHLFQDAGRAGSSSVMLSETSLDERTRDLKAKGLPIASANQYGFMSTAVIQDPDGNEILFVETLGVRHPSLD
jgi:catechol 2,3-dioxygenase-like lactoylglutathione lyase family enzyme